MESLARAKKLQVQRMAEEKDRWWTGAEIFISTRRSDNVVIEKGDTPAAMDVTSRYNNDYSRWDEWVPRDEATLEEVTNITHRLYSLRLQRYVTGASTTKMLSGSQKKHGGRSSQEWRI